jgi:hypothetical protein
MLGEEEQAIGFLCRSLEIAEQMKLQRSEKICLRQLAIVYIRQEKLSDAEAYAARGTDLSEKTKDRSHQVWFLTLWGLLR